MNVELKGTNPVYMQVREQIEAHIRNKTVAAGESLPSPAALSQKLSVDKGEIQRAYFELDRYRDACTRGGVGAVGLAHGVRPSSHPRHHRCREVLGHASNTSLH